MKFLSRLLFLCHLGWGVVFAQNTAAIVSASSCEKPEYPSVSKLFNEEGKVELKFLIGVDGKVIESVVEKSSGFRRLDEAARAGLSKCKFQPATLDGKPQQSWSSMKYTWALEVSKPCVGSDFSKWNSCLGSTPSPIGGVIVAEYVKGKQEGRGIEYDRSGNVIRAGVFEGGKLYAERKLDTNLYPFNSKFVSNSSLGSLIVLPACTGSDMAKWSDCVGTSNSPNGYQYFGDFKNGKFHGMGKHVSNSGYEFLGEFKDGKRNGLGTATFKIWGSYDKVYKFVGQFKDDQRNGLGIEYDKDGGVITEGTWKSDNLIQKHSVDVAIFPFSQGSIEIGKTERERLLAEIEAERLKRKELEDQLRLATQQKVESNNALQPNPPDRRVALVIGNATYKVNPLKNPVNDSTDMARSLRSVGFEVIEANNTTLAQMREVTRRFADKLGNSDVGLVYYSGHGVEVKGKNYLIPVNADIKREYEVVDQAFDASQFLEMMDNIRGPNNKRVNILIVDACRNNELQKSWRSTNNGLARMDAPGGTFISFATAPGRVAADGTGRNSPYTKHLLQALKQPNVPIEQVFKVVRRNVMEETKGEQIPWENSSLVGDFYFTVQR